MTESDRHQNCVLKIKSLLEQLNATIMANSDERGIGGYAYPEIITSAGPRQFTADVFAIMPNGRPVDFEVDYQYKNSPTAEHKKRFRDLWLSKFGITTLRFTVLEVDILDKELLQKELDYRLKQLVMA